MSERSLIPKTELETAEVNVKSAEAQIRSSEAGLTQARAQLNNQRVNLGYTTIVAPIDGIVISRNVDQGQTVASSMNAPTLFVIAADLTKMQVVANIDEADVGRMRPGQNVTFRVDAFPNDTFSGTVQQVRLQPAVVQNVVTYSDRDRGAQSGSEVEAGDDGEREHRDRAARPTRCGCRTPRFASARPTRCSRRSTSRCRRRCSADRRDSADSGSRRASGASRAPRLRGGRQQQGGSIGRSAAGDAPARASSARLKAPQAKPGSAQREPRAGTTRRKLAAAGIECAGRSGAADGRGFGGGGGFDPNMTPEERQRRREEMLKNMTPEQRERFEARMREGRRAGSAAGRRRARRWPGGRNGSSQRGNQRRPQQRPRQPQSRTMASGATTIDSLFGPLPVVETRGMAWLFVNKQLKMVRLRLGITDGTFTEVINERSSSPTLKSSP